MYARHISLECVLSIGLYSCSRLHFKCQVGGTKTFENHTKGHGVAKSNTVTEATLSRAQKAVSADAAARLCVMSQYPFSFTEKPGFVQFCNVLFKMGQQCASAESYDMALSLPKSTCVTTAHASLADQARQQFVDVEYSSDVAYFGACTSDELKSKLTGKKFYDLCITSLVEVSKGMMERAGLMMRSRILLLEEHFGAEDGSNICRTLTDGLKGNYNLDFANFCRKYCFVTDRASNMPTAVGASISNSLVPYGEKWAWCCSHYINTVMKAALSKPQASTEAETISLKTIQNDLKSENDRAHLQTG